MWWMALAGCGSGRTMALALEPVRPGDVVAVFPPDGAMHLYGDVPVDVVLGAASVGVEPNVSWVQGGVLQSLPCNLHWGGTVARCGVLPARISGEAGLVLTVASGAELVQVLPLARLPAPGLGWSLLEGTSVAAFGGGGAAAALVDSYLARGSAFVALDGYLDAPGDYTLVGGPSEPRDGVVGLLPPGFAFVLPVTVGADGDVHGWAPSAWLPVSLDGRVVRILLLDVSLSAHLSGTELVAMSMRAVPAVSLGELSDAIGFEGPALLELVTLDRDRDGDGEGDSATLELVGSPRPMRLASW